VTSAILEIRVVTPEVRFWEYIPELLPDASAKNRCGSVGVAFAVAAQKKARNSLMMARPEDRTMRDAIINDGAL
jgi:hypothetical protein